MTIIGLGPRFLLVGLMLLLMWMAVEGQSNTNASSNASAAISEDPDVEPCPAFRWLDSEYPDTPIYGAPGGCRCHEGLSEINCGYCESDSGCQMESSNLHCRHGFRYAPNDTAKAFKCRLVDSYEELFPNGKASFYLDLEGGFVNISVFNTRNVDSFHLMDCALTGCNFDMEGGIGGKCDLAHCECTESDQCAEWFKDMTLALSGKPAEIKVEEYPISEENDANSPTRLVTIFVGDQVIETACHASTCTPSDPDSIDFQAYQASPQSNSNKSAANVAFLRVIDLIMFVLALGHCL